MLLLIISVRVLIFNIYFKFKNISHKLKMNAEDLLQGIPQDITQDVTTEHQQDSSELRVRLAPLNRFKPSSKIFY